MTADRGAFLIEMEHGYKNSIRLMRVMQKGQIEKMLKMGHSPLYR